MLGHKIRLMPSWLHLMYRISQTHEHLLLPKQLIMLTTVSGALLAEMCNICVLVLQHKTNKQLHVHMFPWVLQHEPELWRASWETAVVSIIATFTTSNQNTRFLYNFIILCHKSENYFLL
jgi:hypothetical protein